MTTSHVLRHSILSVVGLAVLCGCAAPGGRTATGPVAAADAYAQTNRLTWGANASAVAHFQAIGGQAYLAEQLHPGTALLPATVQSQIDAMTVSQQPLVALVQTMEQRRKDSDAVADDVAKKAAQQAYQQEMNRLAKESATRHVLRALYSSNQVQEQMTWFWLNHFSVHLYKSNLRAMVADYEETAIRPHALGSFRALLGAVVEHPAMLRYLDNEQNGVGRINENFARELMELHTLGVDGGYSQQDVQELAKILTGFGVNLGTANPPQKKELQEFYLRKGLFEFNPARHAFGYKELLGQPIRTSGYGELGEALDRLARHPATARLLSKKLATYWLADEPPPAVVQGMVQAFERSGGDIATTLEALFTSDAFRSSSTHKFKDPTRFVVSAVRLAYDEKPILNVNPMLNWINRMGQPLYGRATPDGYSLQSSAWASPGQLATRFEIAKAIGSGSAGLFKPEGPDARELPAFPQFSNALYYESIAKSLSPATRQALDQAASPQEWNTFLLSSPEMMQR